MTKNETIKLRIAELEGRLQAARNLVLNKNMRVEEKLILGQISALQMQLETDAAPQPTHADPEPLTPLAGEIITRDETE